MTPGRPPRDEPVDPSLQREINALASPGLLIGHRLISPGDEDALLDEEAGSIASTVVGARRASGAARIVARELLAQLGHPRAPVPKSASGEPIWPAGIAGSLAHDDEVAVAAVGPRRDVGSPVRADAPACRARRLGSDRRVRHPRRHQKESHHGRCNARIVRPRRPPKRTAPRRAVRRRSRVHGRVPSCRWRLDRHALMEAGS